MEKPARLVFKDQIWTLHTHVHPVPARSLLTYFLEERRAMASLQVARQSHAQPCVDDDRTEEEAEGARDADA